MTSLIWFKTDGTRTEVDRITNDELFAALDSSGADGLRIVKRRRVYKALAECQRISHPNQTTADIKCWMPIDAGAAVYGIQDGIPTWRDSYLWLNDEPFMPF